MTGEDQGAVSEPGAIVGRRLSRQDIGRIWTIDRSEVIERVYRIERGGLLLVPERHEVSGWPSGEAERFSPQLAGCLDRDGWLYGLFHGSRLIGAAVLDGKLVSQGRNQLQLAFLHVSKTDRKQRFGRRLFGLAEREARGRGATGLYISATPSENKVDFYLGLYCVVSMEPDPALLRREPEDIHLEYPLRNEGP